MLSGYVVGGEVHILREGGLGWLIIDYPERRNAVSEAMWRALPERAAELAADPGVRVVLLRGAGDVAFVSGADISEFERTRSSGEASRAYEDLNQRAIAALAEMEKPVVAMIHGFCIGGGLLLALSADLRYAADDARFGLPPARLGLGYSVRGLEMLREIAGTATAKEILFTARPVTAEHALQMGLVNQIFPKTELEVRVRELAGEIARTAPLTLRSAKFVLGELRKAPEERAAVAMEASVRACFDSADYREGVRAFLEKRTPRFEGR